MTIPDYIRHKWFRSALAAALVITGVLGAVIVGWGPRCRGGCTPRVDAATSHAPNLNADNAKWFFDFSVPGDVVEILHTGGPPLKLSQGGDWTLPWDQWRSGSAIR